MKAFVERRAALVLVGVALAWLFGSAGTPAAAPEGQVVSLQAVSIAPRWFDPAEAEGIITPFLFYYALHDAVVKPMPGKPLDPSLAESWSVSADGLTYEFVLRQGVKFHNGDTVSAEDVKFSFERYKGAPIWEPAILYGVGPRIAESALGLITNMAGSAPYEELRLKGK